jgi:hypothetical protein
MYARIPVGRLNPGDFICRTYEIRPKNGSHAIVDIIQPRKPSDQYDRETLSVTISIYRSGKPIRQKTFKADPVFEMRARRNRPCGASLCENCAQDPGSPHRYCPDHWTQVEAAIL